MAEKMSERSITKKMLETIRESKYRKTVEADKELPLQEVIRDNFVSNSKVLMMEAVKNNSKKKILTEEENKEEKVDSSHQNSFTITNTTPQFGDIRTSQEETIRKTISDNISLSKEALKYYPDADDMTLNGSIPALNLKFQFRYNDPSGTDGLYMWTEGTQLTDANTKTINKLRNAYLNWRDSITQDADLMEKLKKAAKERDK